MKLVSIPAPMKTTAQMVALKGLGHRGLRASCQCCAPCERQCWLSALRWGSGTHARMTCNAGHSCKNDMQCRPSEGQHRPSAWLPTQGGRLTCGRCWASFRQCSMPLPTAQGYSCSQTCTQAVAAPSQCWTSYWLCVTPWSGTRRTYSATPNTTPCWGRWGRLRCAPGQ